MIMKGLQLSLSILCWHIRRITAPHGGKFNPGGGKMDAMLFVRRRSALLVAAAATGAEAALRQRRRGRHRRRLCCGTATHRCWSASCTPVPAPRRSARAGLPARNHVAAIVPHDVQRALATPRVQKPPDLRGPGSPRPRDAARGDPRSIMMMQCTRHGHAPPTRAPHARCSA